MVDQGHNGRVHAKDGSQHIDGQKNDGNNHEDFHDVVQPKGDQRFVGAVQGFNVLLKIFQNIPEILGLLQNIGEVGADGIRNEELVLFGHQLVNDVFMGLQIAPEADNVSFNFQNLLDHFFFVTGKNNLFNAFYVFVYMGEHGVAVMLELVDQGV